MEEDIKILEELLKPINEKIIGNNYSVLKQYRITMKERQAIENLIARYKEVKERECIYKSTSSCVKGLSFETLNRLNDSIPKSKIQEKIEELLKEYKDNYTNRAKYKVSYAIKILQELLEEN